MPSAAPSVDSINARPIVLLVEDDRDTVDLYAAHLNGSGYSVTTAQNSEEGCRTFDELRPDIVVTDLAMPGRTDGLRLIEYVAHHASRRVPVIVVTGHDRASIPHGAAANVTSILVKPVLPDLLESELRRTLARARQGRAGGDCPHCGKALPRAQSTPDPKYDYFDPCASGCGRFFRHRSSGRYYRLP